MAAMNAAQLSLERVRRRNLVLGLRKGGAVLRLCMHHERTRTRAPGSTFLLTDIRIWRPEIR